MAPVHYSLGSFPPDKLLDYKALLPYVGRTSRAIARYGEALGQVRDPMKMLHPLRVQEAVFSSRIEGIVASVQEVFGYEAGLKPDSRRSVGDIQEILSYLSANAEAESMLKDFPLSLRVIKNAHAKMMSNDRGKHKTPGEFRRIQNWIGRIGSTINNAKYVPIGADKLISSMSDWEAYLNNDEVDPLLQVAIMHAEFEALHPFLDGNGRTGRMLIPLMLWKKGIIQEPIFSISEYLETVRVVYYCGLLAVSKDDGWTAWSRFFLEVLRVQAEINLSRIKAITKLYDELIPKVREITRSGYADIVLDWMFAKPVFSTTDFLSISGISKNTTRRILDLLCKNKIITIDYQGGGRRPKIYSFSALLDILDFRQEVELSREAYSDLDLPLDTQH